MLLASGSRLGPYEVVAALGQGGMGEVYRARDTRLGRDVAIKVLGSAFVRDPERLARFEREARLLASLNHPNIGAIYGVEDAGGVSALVLELVDGQTLAEGLLPGPLPLVEALTIARQIAAALDAAHEKGIIHRDLKPANIMITPAGVVKVLDLGLAKAVADEASRPNLPESPTVTSDGTRAGVILGTVSYMSPEQARGIPVDKRTDVWAFGCVLFEMLTGRNPFAGITVSDTIAAVLEREPDWRQLPRRTHPRIVHLLRRCLQKDPAQRLRDIADARHEIDEALAPRAHSQLRRRTSAAIVVAAALAIAAGVYLVRQSDRRVPQGRGAWIQLTNLESVTQPALSPDARMLVFIRGTGTFTTNGEIYVKLLPNGDPIPLTHDNLRKMGPVFSPDGARIAYTATDGNSWDTWIVPALRGEARRWLRNASGLTWAGSHHLLFSEIKAGQGQHMVIVRSDESRGEARDLYVPPVDAGMAHRSYASPDGQQMLVVEMDEKGVWLPCRLMRMGGGPSRPVGPRAPCTGAAWAPDGTRMYFSANAGDGFHIWQQRSPEGEPEQITSGPTEEEGLAIAADGRSAITSVGLQQRAVWIHDAAGERQVSLEGYAYWPLLSADGRKVCYRVTRSAGTGQSPGELWTTELSSGRSERLLPGQMVTGHDLSRDDRVVAAVQAADGTRRLWLAWLDGREPPRRIPEAEGDNPRFGEKGEIFFLAAAEGSGRFLFRTREDGTGREKLTRVGGSVLGVASPDGEWLSAPGLETGSMWAYSTAGRTPVPILAQLTSRLRWASDGTRVYLSVQSGEASGFAFGRTYVLPLAKGSFLPSLPPGGFRTEAELAAAPGVVTLPHGDLAPGPSPAVYAFSRTTITRNLYRIPLP